MAALTVNLKRVTILPMKLTDKRRGNIAKVAINIGCICFAGLVVTNFAKGADFSIVRFTAGILATIFFFIIAFLVEK